MTHVKVFFALEQDEDGYPDVATESVWAQATLVPDEFVIDNIPFYARTANCGDTVRVRLDDEGVRWFVSLVSRGGGSLIRVIMRNETPAEPTIANLEAMGCEVERARKGFFALSVPLTVELKPVQTWLSEQEKAGLLDYEEPILRHP